MIKQLLSSFEAWRIERLRMDYDNLSKEKQALVQEYFDNHLQEYWIEQASEFYSRHDYDDVDYFLEQAWEMYLEH
jgi:hypothetical protein